MNQDFYQILGINKTAAPEEIKKAYRKLAQQWHPDKWNAKSLEEREWANERMQEVNQAYEVLSDEDKRKRYDLGETDFSYETSNDFDWHSYYDQERASLNNESEKIRFQLEAVARRDVINTIGFEMSTTEIFSRKLDSKLWEPYSKWGEKVLELKVFFTADGRLDKVNSPLYKFQEEMINAIRKRKEELKNGINNPLVDKARINAIKSIERELGEKNSQTQNLGEYSNYRDQINNLDKVWQINSLRDKVKKYIRDNLEEKSNNDDLTDLKKSFYEISSSKNEKSWNDKEESLRAEVKELRKNSDPKVKEKLTKKINALEDLAKQLLREIQELKAEIQEVKEEEDNSPNASFFIKQKEQELQVKQLRLQKLESIISSNNNNNPSPFPILPAIGAIGIFFLFGLVVYKLKRKRLKT